MRIVVSGGSGLIGTRLENRLREQGYDVVAASPDAGVNTITGAGLAEALARAQVVVDVANPPSFEDKAALADRIGRRGRRACRSRARLAAQRDRREGRREAIADAHARYFGAESNDRSLTPGDHPGLGPTRFEAWLSHMSAQR